MSTHSDIAKAFVTPYHWRQGPKSGHNVFREPWDNSYNSQAGSGDIIYSYGRHFPVAVRNDNDKTFLVNGDRWGHSTAGHQSQVRGAIASRNSFKDYKVLTVPFSIFRRAYSVSDLTRLHVSVIDVGVDKEICKCITCDTDFTNYTALYEHRNATNRDAENNWTQPHKTRYFHQLAPSTFSVKMQDNSTPRYFISGFDETANQRNHDGYFLSELPAKPRDIAHAFEMLRPTQVKIADKIETKVLRQGDIFAIPSKLTTRFLKKHGADYQKGGLIDKYVWGTAIKVLDYPRLFGTSHVANETITYRGMLFARGTLRHRPTEFGRTLPEHMNVTIGKDWHRIVRNTALASYTTGGRVD